MNKVNVKELQDLFTDLIGAVKLRQNKTCITVTFVDVRGCNTAENAVQFVGSALAHLRMGNQYGVRKGTATRVYLVELPHSTFDHVTLDEEEVTDTPFFSADDFWNGTGTDLTDDEYTNLAGVISKIVGEAHEATQLENLLSNRLERDIEFFINNASDAALEVLGEGYAFTDEIKNLMRLSYIIGRSADARTKRSTCAATIC